MVLSQPRHPGYTTTFPCISTNRIWEYGKGVSLQILLQSAMFLRIIVATYVMLITFPNQFSVPTYYQPAGVMVVTSIRIYGRN